MKAPTVALLLSSFITIPLVNNIKSAESVPVRHQEQVKDFLKRTVAHNKSNLLQIVEDLSRKSCYFQGEKEVHCQVGMNTVVVSDEGEGNIQMYAQDLLGNIFISESSDGSPQGVSRQINAIREVISETTGAKLSSR